MTNLLSKLDDLTLGKKTFAVAICGLLFAGAALGFGLIEGVEATKIALAALGLAAMRDAVRQK